METFVYQELIDFCLTNKKNAQNIVLGVMNILKMLTCFPDADQIDLPLLLKDNVDAKTRSVVQQAGPLDSNTWTKHSAKLFFVPFFTVHYGIFCLVHGVFVVVLLGSGNSFVEFGGQNGLDLSADLLFAAVALGASHLVSFFINYLGCGENRRTILPVLMVRPYGRIIVLHLAIVLGAFATIALGSPIFLLVIMIVGKTIIDLNLHLREHQLKSPAASCCVCRNSEQTSN